MRHEHLPIIACLLAGACAGEDVGSESAASTATRSYLVLSTDTTVPQGLARRLAAAGGSVTRSIDPCGAVLVDSSRADFAAAAQKEPGVRSVVSDVRLQFAKPFTKTFRVAPGHAASIGGAMGMWSESGAKTPPPPPPPGIAEPFDPGYRAQWGLQAVGAKAAWDKGHFGQGVRVAVLDTGVAYNPYYDWPPVAPPSRESFHPDLAPNLNLELSTSFVPGEPYYQPAFDEERNYHGTHVMGIIGAAINDGYVVGVAPQAELVAVKVLDDHDGRGSFGQVLAGLCYAASIHADIANMSLARSFSRHGFCTPDGCLTARDVAEIAVAFNRAVSYAARMGMTIVAVAGNDGVDHDTTSDLISIPGSLPHVLAVSATAPLGWAVNPRTASLYQPAHYTDSGQSYIDFAAPGGEWIFQPDWLWCSIELSTFVLQGPCWALDLVLSDYGNFSGVLWTAGTSMAAPHIAGLAALLISEAGRKLSPAQVEAALRARALDLGKKGNDDFYGSGFGRFDACVPTTCAQSGAACGTIVDTCGGMLDCGACPDGGECVREKCCRPEAEVCAGRTCGQVWDYCRDGPVDCGGCADSDVCGSAGSCCTPSICQEAECGVAYDTGCETGVYCGECGDGQVCRWWNNTCCVQTTCADQGRSCGYIDDGCGVDVLWCGGCGEGQECSATGTCCTPTVFCDPERCGPVDDDGCGNPLGCGCVEGQECNYATGTCCTPTVTCDQQSCGSIDDGCGNSMTCGCDDGQVCNWSAGTCCTPTLICDQQTCGYFDDGCGNWMFCGCDEGSVCDWDVGTCCTPTQTCGSEAAECGYAVDNCHQQIYCGDCGEGETCFQNSCIPTPPSKISCGCVDGTTVEYCQPTPDLECPDPVTRQYQCNLACVEHGTLYWDICNPDPICSGPSPRPPPPTPPPPMSPGSSLLGCACVDGKEVTVCVADCAADDACPNLCAYHLGVAATSCTVDDASCASAATPGTILARCLCSPDLTIDVCVDNVDCADAAARDALCGPVCAPNGGLWEVGCIPDYPGCAGR